MSEHGGKALAQAVERAYQAGESDYFLSPLVRVDQEGRPVGRIRPGDSVVFCCRRGEREVELTELFTDPDFRAVERRFLPGLYFVPLTLYHQRFAGLPVAFAPAPVAGGLGEVLSQNGIPQLRAAESEKFAHVTFFFDGGRHQPWPGEDTICVPSPKGVPFAEVPGLSLPQLTRQVRERMADYSFVLVNFANGDVIGHTASTRAKIAAAACVDAAMKELVEDAREKGFTVLITADHGNLEELYTRDGKPHAAHTRAKVPFIVVGDEALDKAAFPKDGRLENVAPTVLRLLDIQPPAGMAESLLSPDVPPQKKVLLLVLDGWGMGRGDQGDPIFLGDTPYWDHLLASCPRSLLDASGEAVGLEAGKPGNSEAGHMNLGAGRVVLQDDQRLTRAIAQGTFRQNPVLREAVDRCRQGHALHLLAYLTKDSSHGSIDYALELCRMAKGLPEVYLHIIFDGRSTPPGSAPGLLLELGSALEETGTGQIVGGAGRGYVLDRDKNYPRVKAAYDAMVEGTGNHYI